MLLAPTPTLIVLYAKLGGVLGVTLICTSSVSVKPPESVTRSRNVPLAAVHEAASDAVTVPLVLISPVAATPVAVPPAMSATVKLFGGSVRSLTVPKVATVVGLAC